MLKEGMKAVDFSLSDKDGKIFSLKDFKENYIILFFYPKDNTPGCTVESVSFSENLNKFKKLNAIPVGISGGDNKTKSKFCEKNKLETLMLSDSDFKISTAYGIYGEKSFMGKKYMGINRVTFILDNKRIIIKVFDKVKPAEHINEVLDFLAKK